MRKDPSGTAIEEKEGEELGKMIEDEGSSVVVYFCIIKQKQQKLFF
jgi:hypothetical protein